MLFGPDPLVEAFMDLIANNLGTVFTVEKPGNHVLFKNPYPATFFSPENVVCFRLDYFMEANNMNPDQTAPFLSSLIWVHVVCNLGYQRTQADERSRQ